MKEKGIRCLVTGGSGSFGSILVDLLIENGYKVNVLDLAPLKSKHVKSIEFIQKSILDPIAVEKALEDVDLVFHCASCLDTSLFVLNNSREEVNVNGTKVLLEQCLKSKVQCLVYTSTHNVCFRGETIEMADESFMLSENEYMDEYSRTKSEAEKLVLKANRSICKDGHSLLTCALRPGVIWGEGDKHFEKFLHVSCFGFCFRPPKDIQWDWVSTLDLAEIHLLTGNKLLEDSIRVNNEKEGDLATFTSTIEGKPFFVGEPGCAVDYWNKILEGLELPALSFVLPLWFWILVGFFSELIAFLLSPFYNLRQCWFYWTIPESYKLIKTHTFSNKRWKEQFPDYECKPKGIIIQQAVDYWKSKAEEIKEKTWLWNLFIVSPFRRIKSLLF